MPHMCSCGAGVKLETDGFGGSSRTLLHFDDRQKSSDGGERLHSFSFRRRTSHRQSSDLRRARQAESLRGVFALGAGAAVGGADRFARYVGAAYLVSNAIGGAKHWRAAGG